LIRRSCRMAAPCASESQIPKSVGQLAREPGSPGGRKDVSRKDVSRKDVIQKGHGTC
jgi:hypothetical protein